MLPKDREERAALFRDRMARLKLRPGQVARIIGVSSRTYRYWMAEENPKEIPDTAFRVLALYATIERTQRALEDVASELQRFGVGASAKRMRAMVAAELKRIQEVML